MSQKTIVITGIPHAMREFQDIERFLKSKTPMRGITNDIKDGIIEKTDAGHDYRGRNFKPYSVPYKKRRAKAGLPTKPDLRVTGDMLGSIKAEAIDATHGRVEVAAKPHEGLMADMLAQVHNTGSGKQPQREFMNITDNALKTLQKKHYDDPLLEIVRRYR